MQDASDAVDTYLTNGYGIGLEQVLAEATQGLLSLHIATVVKVTSACVAMVTFPDGGRSELHQGTLRMQGVTYYFRCYVFIDLGGERFVSHIAEFAPRVWEAGVRIPTA